MQTPQEHIELIELSGCKKRNTKTSKLILTSKCPDFSKSIRKDEPFSADYGLNYITSAGCLRGERIYPKLTIGELIQYAQMSEKKLKPNFAATQLKPDSVVVESSEDVIERLKKEYPGILID